MIETSAFAALAATLADASSRVQHPFLGEHANASAVHREDGTASMRLGAKPASYNKHRGYINGDGLFEPELGFMGRASEFLFGDYETDFQKKVRDITESKGKKINKKLGQANKFPSILKNEDGFIWTGEIYMGQLSKMDIVYDTGSDWLVVEGSTCENCEGNTYDIQPSLETGDAR